MITTEWIANFGNNMFQYAVLYGVSRKTGYTLTTNGWHGNSTDRSPVGNGKELFQLPAEPDFSLYNQTGIFNDSTDQHYDPNIFKIPDGTKLRGYFQTDKYFIDYRDDLLKCFTFKNCIYDDRANQIINGLNKKAVICIHSREGDAPQQSVVDSKYFKSALDVIMQKNKLDLNDIGIIYISDNKNSNKLDFLHNTNVPIIFSKEVNFVDLCIMKNSNHCIMSPSSFGWWGAWLNTKHPTIVSPFNWMNYNGVLVNTQNGWFPMDIKMSHTQDQVFIKKNGDIL